MSCEEAKKRAEGQRIHLRFPFLRLSHDKLPPLNKKYYSCDLFEYRRSIRGKRSRNLQRVNAAGASALRQLVPGGGIIHATLQKRLSTRAVCMCHNLKRISIVNVNKNVSERKKTFI